ncbi:MAG: hypothetical protein K0R90_142 [Oscillospiraceae bacterium]|nr:hypothetical protein [Oscillospiraceae bacterium]
MSEHYKLGMRAVKTAVVVFLCLLVGFIFKKESAFYSCIAGVVCLQPTYKKSFFTGSMRFLGTIIGGIFGYVVIQFFPFIPYYYNLGYVFIIPMFILIVIYVCKIIKKPEAVVICCIVFLSIVINFEHEKHDALIYVINRVIDTAIGIVLAVLVNRFFFTKRQQENPEQVADNPE